MTAEIQISPDVLPEKTVRFILAQSEAWGCSPGEAVTRLLDTLSERAGFTPPPQPAQGVDELTPTKEAA